VTLVRRGRGRCPYEAVEDAGPVLKALEPVAYECFEPVEGDDGEVGQAALDVRPYPLDRVQGIEPPSEPERFTQRRGRGHRGYRGVADGTKPC
jgi:hypothetical protein